MADIRFFLLGSMWVIAVIISTQLVSLNQHLTYLDRRLGIIDMDLQDQTIAIEQAAPCVVLKNQGSLGAAGDAVVCGDGGLK